MLFTFLFKLKRFLGELSIPFLETRTILGTKIYQDYNELKNQLLSHMDSKSLKLIYLNREDIHEILYKSEQVIEVERDLIKNLNNKIYLDLLIKDEPDVINYTFPINCIVDVFNKYNKLKDNNPKKVILLKILMDFIEAYQGFNEKEDERKKLDELNQKLEKSKTYCKYKDDIMEKSIDIFFIEIIIKLINRNINNNKNGKDSLYKIVDELDLKNVYITKTMFNIFHDFLINEQRNIEAIYFIQNLEDIININKINFYFLVLNLLKNSFFIYQYSFLLNTRKLLIESINKNLYTFVYKITDNDEKFSEEEKSRIDYVIKILTDSEYYYDKYEKMKAIIKDGRFKYTFPLMQILMNIKINDIDFKEEQKIDNLLNQWNSFEKQIKDKKYKKIYKTTLKKLYEYFNDEKNEKNLLKIFTKEEINNLLNIDINNDNYEYITKNEENKEKENEKDKEENNELDQAVIGNISDIEEEREEEEEIISDNNNNNVEKKEISCTGTTIFIETVIPNSNSNSHENTEASESNNDNIFPNREILLKKFQKSDKYKIIEFLKTLEESDPDRLRHCYYHKTLNLSKGHYLIWGSRHKALLYNSLFEKKLELSLFEIPYNIYEIQNKEEQKKYKEEIKLMICSENKLEALTINLQNYIYYVSTLSQEYNISYEDTYLKDDSYIIRGKRGVFTLEKESKKNSYKKKKIFGDNFVGSINISEQIYALTSNALFPQGEDKLLIYDFNTNKIIKEINNYSFDFSSHSSNGLCLIDLEKIKGMNYKRKILLCACEKNKKNGFLVLNMNLEQENYNEFCEHFFIETKGFEPHCFCQISNVDNNNPIDGQIYKEENIDIDNTQYFLVGGFDPDKRIGCIKLYKIIYDIKNNKAKVKFLVDIITENIEEFHGFNMNISSITQSKITGNFIINCWDDNVYLFKRPNLECF